MLDLLLTLLLLHMTVRMYGDEKKMVYKYLDCFRIRCKNAQNWPLHSFFIIQCPKHIQAWKNIQNDFIRAAKTERQPKAIIQLKDIFFCLLTIIDASFTSQPSKYVLHIFSNKNHVYRAPTLFISDIL